MTEAEIKEAIENKKRALKRYRKAMACVRRLQNKVADIAAKMEKVRSPNMSGMPRGGVPVTLDDMLNEKMELEGRIQRRIEASKPIRAEILAEIDTLDDPRMCDVLEDFFIGCLNIDDIAEKEGYAERTVYRLYEDGVRRLTVM